MDSNIMVSRPTEGEIVETLEFPWSRQENEPENWYMRFHVHYLSLGPTRTLLKAFMACVQVEDPTKFESYVLNPPQSVTSQWSQMASAWEWRKRARAYDEVMMRDASRVVDAAYKTIIENTQAAAQTLVDNLKNPRLAVAAAKEILDRGGLPGSSTVRHEIVPFTADELGRASDEVHAWENQLKLPSETPESSG
jgi:hypothetical protein